MYSPKDNNENSKTTGGIEKNVIKKDIKHEDNKNTLFKTRQIYHKIRESSFNITRGGGGGGPERGPSKNFWGKGWGPKICILQNQHITSSYRLDAFQLNTMNLMTSATQLYHVVSGRYIL